MRHHIISLAALSISLVGGVAAAEPHREVVRVNEHVNVRPAAVHENVVVHENVNVRGPVVRENVNVRGPVVRENVNVNVHGPVVRENVVVHENVRENVILREPGREGVIVNGRGGPVWHEGVHFTDYHVRPEYRYERWAPIAGYNWHRGDWVFNGVEWVWQPGWYVRVDL